MTKSECRMRKEVRMTKGQATRVIERVILRISAFVILSSFVICHSSLSLSLVIGHWSLVLDGWSLS